MGKMQVRARWKNISKRKSSNNKLHQVLRISYCSRCLYAMLTFAVQWLLIFYGAFYYTLED